MRAVDPTISAISTVRRFRSPSRAARVERIPAEREGSFLRSAPEVDRTGDSKTDAKADPKADPHAVQLSACGELPRPHVTHTRASMAPQLAQKFASGSFRYWQLAQNIIGPK